MHVVWLSTGLGCDGESVALTSATSPSLENLLAEAIPRAPRIVLHNAVYAPEVGERFMQAFYDAEDGRLGRFVLVLEGALGNEMISGEGHWSGTLSGSRPPLQRRARGIRSPRRRSQTCA